MCEIKGNSMSSKEKLTQDGSRDRDSEGQPCPEKVSDEDNVRDDVLKRIVSYLQFCNLILFSH